VKTGAIVIALVVGAFAVLMGIIYAAETYLPPVLEYLVSVVSPLVSYFTQYNVMWAVMIGIDILILIGVRSAFTDPTTREFDRDVFTQIGAGILVLGTLFGLNTFFTYGMNMPGPSYDVGWSYMFVEQGLNLLVLVIGILVLRAYMRCEHPEIPGGVEP
jgi:hypothetical protein